MIDKSAHCCDIEISLTNTFPKFELASVNNRQTILIESQISYLKNIELFVAIFLKVDSNVILSN